MTGRFLAGAFLAVALSVTRAGAAPTPPPIPPPDFPKRPMHVRLDVEVNKLGQVVRIKNGTLSHDDVFDTMTIGNALQMWIRHPDGTAEVGLYHVDYSYNPKTRTVSRTMSLASRGGTWANDSGAATKMAQVARREALQEEAQLKAEERRREAESSKHLPDIHAIVKKAVVKPTSSPKPF